MINNFGRFATGRSARAEDAVWRGVLPWSRWGLPSRMRPGQRCEWHHGNGSSIVEFYCIGAVLARARGQRLTPRQAAILANARLTARVCSDINGRKGEDCGRALDVLGRRLARTNAVFAAAEAAHRAREAPKREARRKEAIRARLEGMRQRMREATESGGCNRAHARSREEWLLMGVPEFGALCVAARARTLKRLKPFLAVAAPSLPVDLPARLTRVAAAVPNDWNANRFAAAWEGRAS